MGGAPFGVRRIEIFLIKTDLIGGKSCTPIFFWKNLKKLCSYILRNQYW